MSNIKLIKACEGKTSSQGGLNIAEFKDELKKLFPELVFRINNCGLRSMLHDICKERGIIPHTGVPKLTKDIELKGIIDKIKDLSIANKGIKKENDDKIKEQQPQQQPHQQPQQQPHQQAQEDIDLKLPNRNIYINLEYSKIPFIQLTKKIIDKIVSVVDDIDYIIRYKNLFDNVISGEFDGIDNYNYELENKISHSKYGIGSIHINSVYNDGHVDFISTLYTISLVLLELSKLDIVNINKILKGNVHYLCLNAITRAIEVDINKLKTNGDINSETMTFEKYITENFLFFIEILCKQNMNIDNPKDLAIKLVKDSKHLLVGIQALVKRSGLTDDRAIEIAKEVFIAVGMFENCKDY